MKKESAQTKTFNDLWLLAKSIRKRTRGREIEFTWQTRDTKEMTAIILAAKNLLKSQADEKSRKRYVSKLQSIMKHYLGEPGSIFEIPEKLSTTLRGESYDSSALYDETASEIIQWLRSLVLEFPMECASNTDFVATTLQQMIIDYLKAGGARDGFANTSEIIGAIPTKTESTIKAAIVILMKCGLLQNRRGRGYYLSAADKK